MLTDYVKTTIICSSNTYLSDRISLCIQQQDDCQSEIHTEKGSKKVDIFKWSGDKITTSTL